jgi:hypothetical protein
MSKLAIKLLPEIVRSLTAAQVQAAYMGIGTVFTNPIRIIFVQNLTDASLMFSFDGVNDHFPLATNGFMLLDVTSNKTQAGGFFISEQTRIYVREIGNPATGNVYVSAFYGSNT